MSAEPMLRHPNRLDPAVVGRVAAVTTLRLVTAAHFGGGEGDVTDAQLLRDADGEPFIPGASLAGACRAYLRGLSRVAPDDLEMLFGGREQRQDEGSESPTVQDDDWQQSTLILDDAFPTGELPAPALRDHVRLDALRRTAADGGKFDQEVLEPGSAFTLRLELPLRQAHAEQLERLRTLFNALLDALEFGEVHLGAHTRRGLGKVETTPWQVLELDFRDVNDVVRWLTDTPPGDDATERWGRDYPGSGIAKVGTRRYCYISATLELEGPILVRATPPGEQADAPDAVQFRSGGQPVVPGSSLAGALRHRALRICRTLASDQERAADTVDGIFGPGFRDNQPPTEHRSSPLRVDEAPISGSRSQRQTRIAIDRFTGGTMPGALIEEMPEWPDAGATATLQVSVRLDDRDGSTKQHVPFEAGCGLLLLLLKDLCTGDLPVGGGAAVGRGVLRGRSGRIEIDDGSKRRWAWRAEGGGITLDGDRDPLEQWVTALGSHLRGDAG